MIKIKSFVQYGNTVEPAPVELVKNEPMLFSCDAKAARKLGGPLTQRFLDALPHTWLDAADFIVDSRVHMLMPGWFPCIPGYHHDDVPRTREDGQPNYETPEYKSDHVMLMMGDNVAPTEFAIGFTEMPRIRPFSGPIYKYWHDEVVRQLKIGRDLQKRDAPMNQLLYFNWQTFHQGVRATGNGWRFFIRASRNTNRKPANELRRQVQVYLDTPMEGW